MDTRNMAEELVGEAEIGSDFDEFAEMTDGQIAQHLRNPSEWREPRDWGTRIPPKPYPIHALPDPMRSAVESVVASIGAPVEVVAGHALAVLSAATSGRLMIDVKGDGSWMESPALYVATFTPSGSRKTPGKVNIERSIDEAWQKWGALNQRDILTSKTRLKTAEKNCAALEKKYEANPKDEFALGRLIDAKEEVLAAKEGLIVAPNPMASNSTVESLERIVMANNNGMAFVSETENDFMDNISGRYSNKGAQTSLMNKSWSSIERARTTRISEGTDIETAFPFVAMGLHLQSSVARVYAEIPQFVETGFFARMLLSRPDVVLKRPDESRPPLDDQAMKGWDRYIEQMVDATWNRPLDDMLVVSFDDLRPFEELEGHYLDLIEHHSFPESVSTWMSKAHGHTARLAGLFGAAADPTSKVIPTDEFFSDARELMEFHEFEMTRYFDEVIEVDGSGQLIERCLRWVARRVTSEGLDQLRFTTTAAHQALKGGKTGLRSDDVKAMLDLAAELGWVRRVPNKRPQDAGVWIAHPSVPEKFGTTK